MTRVSTMIVVAVMLFMAGCSMMPDSITIGYMQEKYKSDPHAWDGVGVSVTWELE